MTSNNNQPQEVEVKADGSQTAANCAAFLKSFDDQYFITDVSANLTNKKFARDLDSVIQRAQDAGVKKVIASATNLQASKEALRLTRLFPDYVYCTAGIHPNDAKVWDTDTERLLRELLSNPECVAVGQCGLDYSKTFSDPEDQKETLEKQIKLASELKMPIFIFEKEGYRDLEKILKNLIDLPKIIIHSFCGKIDELNTYLRLGCYIGLTGSIWKDKSEDGLKKILEDQLIPLDHLLVESDSPFMYPNTRANQIPSTFKEMLTEKSLSFLHKYCTFQRNEPCSLPVTIELLAAFYKLKPDEVAMQTTYNALKIFGLN